MKETVKRNNRFILENFQIMNLEQNLGCDLNHVIESTSMVPFWTSNRFGVKTSQSLVNNWCLRDDCNFNIEATITHLKQALVE